MPSNAPASNYALGSLSAFTDYISGMLGGNLIDVELTTKDYANAFLKAKTIWFQRGNVNLNEQFLTLNTQTGNTNYDLSTYPAAVDTIIKLAMPTSTFYTQNPFSIALFTDLMLGLINQQAADIYTYEGTLQFLDLINLYTVAYPDYIFNRRTQQLQLLKAPTTNDVWFIHCYTFPADMDLYNLLWVQEYTLAECKNILGHAYQKYSEIQGPAGQISLPGTALIQEASDMKKELIQNIEDYVDSDQTGGYILLG